MLERRTDGPTNSTRTFCLQPHYLSFSYIFFYFICVHGLYNYHVKQINFKNLRRSKWSVAECKTVSFRLCDDEADQYHSTGPTVCQSPLWILISNNNVDIRQTAERVSQYWRQVSGAHVTKRRYSDQYHHEQSQRSAWPQTYKQVKQQRRIIIRLCSCLVFVYKYLLDSQARLLHN